MKAEAWGPHLEAARAALVQADPSQGEGLTEVALALDALASALETTAPGQWIAALRQSQELLQEKLSATQATAVLERVGSLLIDLERASRPPASAAPAPGDRLELPPEVDQELFGEFLAQARLTSEELAEEVRQLELADPEALPSLLRRIHTLKGESGVLGLLDLEKACHGLESWLSEPAPVWTRVEQIDRFLDWLADALVHYAAYELPDSAAAFLQALPRQRSGAQPEDRGGAGAVAPASRAVPSFVVTTPAAAPSHTEGDGELPGWDEEAQELVAEFLQESDENLGTVDGILLAMEEEGADAERVNSLFRVFHTMKGVSGFLGLTQVTALAHITENMLDQVRGGALPADGRVIDLVFDATACMRRLMLQVRSCLENASPLHKLAEVGPLIERLKEVVAGHLPEGLPEATPVNPGDRLGEILLRQGVVSSDQVEAALIAQRETGRRFGEELVARGSVAPKAVAHALRGQLATKGAGTRIRDVLKVDLERVDHLVETIGELVIVESMVSHAPELRMLPTHLRNYLNQFQKITRELQEIGTQMRMVPVRGEFQKMTRMVRDLARKSEKKVRVEVRGEGTEMDRSMVEAIADPLVHLIRNAVDHGVETPEVRRASGKPEQGTIVLSAAHEGSNIIIEISDDGKGINRDAVLTKAVNKGLVRDGVLLSDSEVFDLIFLPGFSTAAQVTEISGRGVGMDVVKRNIEAMRGRILTTSTPGRGSTFRLMLPLTLAIIDGMVVRSGAEQFIIPTLTIVESLQPSAEMLFTVAGRGEIIVVRGESLPLLRLDDILQVPGAERDLTRALIIIVETSSGKIGLVADEVLSQQQVVIKSMGVGVRCDGSFSGAAVLSNGRVGLILNVEELIQQAGFNRQLIARGEEVHAAASM